MRWLNNVSRSLKRIGSNLGNMLGGGQQSEIVITGGKSVKTNQCAPSIINDKEPEICAIKGKKSKECKRQKQATLKKSVHKGSCLTDTALNKLITAYNKHHPEDKIPSRTKLDKKWEAFVSKMDSNLSEHEWLDLPFVKEELSTEEIKKLKEEHFRPAAPKEWVNNPTTWLNTDDIDKCLIQYTEKYPDFKYFGAVPSDFHLREKTGHCMISDLCSINLKSLIKQKYKFIGAVFNFDPHNKSGSHWVAMFVNIPKQEINYLDSNGYQPIPPIKQLLLTVKGQAAKMGKSFKIQYCNKRHQFKNTECGMYAINFISSQLEGKDFKEIVNKVVKDEEMNQRRQSFFNIIGSIF